MPASELCLLRFPTAPLLRAEGLTVRLSGRTVLEGLDFELGDGLSVVLGANGAGKSVLLRTLHGLIPPAAGRLAWRGGRPPRRALVFQRPVLLRRSVRAQIRFALACAGVPWRERARRTDGLLAVADLVHLADRPARRLSGGEQQRLQLATALALDPELLLLDEPTASLDPAAILAFERVVARVCARGVSVLLVTHDIHQARRLADRVLFLERGRLVEQAPASRFFAAPASAAARAYLEGRLVP